MPMKMIPGYTATCDAPGCTRDLAEDYSGGEYGSLDKSTIENEWHDCDWVRTSEDKYYCAEHRYHGLDKEVEEIENADPTPPPPPFPLFDESEPTT